MTPLLAAVRSDPRVVCNPLDLGFELLRPSFFKTTEFAAPAGDPGWFGPSSAVWYVHSHTPVMVLGLSTGARIETLHPSIVYATADHSRVPVRENGVRTGQVDVPGLVVRAAHSFSFFMSVAYGSTEAAENACRAVTGMHTKLKGVRPDGLPYDADEPSLLRWTYATVVWGLAIAHEHYHPNPLRGTDLDCYYREFTRVGEALGGSDLPATKRECLEVLAAGSEEIALTQAGADILKALDPQGSSLLTRPLASLMDWAIMDLQPPWAQRIFRFKPAHPAIARLRRGQLRALLNAAHKIGEVREITLAHRRAGPAASRLVDGVVPAHTDGIG